jgi:hypothetical protein
MDVKLPTPVEFSSRAAGLIELPVNTDGENLSDAGGVLPIGLGAKKRPAVAGR